MLRVLRGCGGGGRRRRAAGSEEGSAGQCRGGECDREALGHAVHGHGASLEGIAREAGVAIGTLYRHFPSRLDLVGTLFDAKYTELLAAAEEAAALDDAWEGFCRYLEKLCEVQACDRAFNGLVSARLPLHVAGRDMYERAKDLCIQIMRNAQEQGVLRADVTPQDIAFVIWSQAGIIQATRTIAPEPGAATST
ncbi:TetR/AcrR family transcriptional regulator [Streptomyces fagopyri]|uniref:TetR/AcrR family transcriptional regulator n=1 Tax=Streptomyces fagopyri TaxID=2662397 RepID=UPI00381855C0